MQNKGTREQILNIRLITEKNCEYNIHLVLRFLDYNKAFDCVRWSKVWQIMDEMGVPAHLITLTRNLYADSRAKHRLMDDMHSRSFEPSKGVRQGCVLSPIFFNEYG